VTHRTQRIVRTIVIVSVLAALVWFARTLNWTEAWRAIRATSVGVLVVAIIVNLLSVVLKALRWWIFLRPVGATSVALALRATFTGAALNNILIANSGEAAKVIIVSRASNVASEKVLATVALERLFEIVGYVVMLAVTVTLFTLPSALGNLRLVAIVAVVVMIGLLWYLLRHPERAELPVLEGDGLLHRARRYGRGFFRTLSSISTGRRFAAATVLSVGVWALQVTTYQLTARAAHFEIPVVATVAALLAVNLGFATRATPGNVGVFQLMYAMTAVAFGLDKDQATGVALLIQIQQILPVTILGLVATPGIMSLHRQSKPDTIVPGEPGTPLSPQA
jgi:uncharacterized protein (TIRG00374 family)